MPDGRHQLYLARYLLLSGDVFMMLNVVEVARHNSRESCWIIIQGQVYDVTDFLDDHPAGSNIILRYAGKVEPLLRHLEIRD